MLISFWFSSPFCNPQCLKNTKWWFVRTLYFNFNVLRYRRLGHSCSFYSTRLMLNQCRLTVILEYWFPLRSGCSRTSHFTSIKLFVHKNNNINNNNKTFYCQILSQVLFCFWTMIRLLACRSFWFSCPFLDWEFSKFW